MGRIRVATLAAAALMLVPASGAQAKPKHHDHGSAQLEKAVSVRNIVKHQTALQTHRRHERRDAVHHDARITRRRSAYVRERMQRAGLNTKVMQFDMPDWQENAPPVLQQLTPDRHDLHARAPRPTTTTRPWTSSRSSTRRRRQCRAPRWCRRPTSSLPSTAANQHERLRAGGLPRGDGRSDLADPARHLRHRQQARQRPGGGSGRRDHVQPGRQPRARSNAGFRAGPTDLNIPAVFSSYAVGKELYDAFTDGENPTVRLETSGETIPHFYPQVVAETQDRRSAAPGARGRAPRLGAGRAGHQRRRLRHGVAARARRAAREAQVRAPQQGALPVVRR